MPWLTTSVLGRVIFSGALLVYCAAAAFAQADPSSRVVRLNYLNGNVTMKPAEANEWMPAERNRPFSTGDSLNTDLDGRAELHTDVAAIRMGSRTAFSLTSLTDRVIRIQLNDGDMNFRVHNFGPSDSLEIDTPNAAVTVLRDGIYRFRVDSGGGISFLVVRQGTALVNAGGQAATVNPGNSILVSGLDRPTYDLEQAPEDDEFDVWCRQRDDHELRLASIRYVPPTLIGYEDLDDNGGWEQTGLYGPVWYPRAVPVDWAPYRFGHWVWISPWGWTWVDDARWGFAPFHYGRWVYVNSRWGWCPGPIVVVKKTPVFRPRYAPALVAWVGGAHWGVSVTVGGPPMAWVVLGFGELYTPPYHCSQNYFSTVNVNNTRVVNNVNITNVYQTVYVNKTVYNQTFVHMNSPNAVVAMPASAFAAGQPVKQQAIALNSADIQQLHPATPQQVPNAAALAHAVRPAPQPASQLAAAGQPIKPASFNQSPGAARPAAPGYAPRTQAPAAQARQYPRMTTAAQAPPKKQEKPKERKAEKY